MGVVAAGNGDTGAPGGECFGGFEADGAGGSAGDDDVFACHVVGVGHGGFLE